ncbi:MAG: TIM44-like domain-containing protein [Pseudorhodoplanes sp.]
MRRFRPLLALFAVATALVFLIVEADARPGRGGSFGSRGARTYSQPAATPTAPGGGAAMERSMTQQTRPGALTNSATQTAGGGVFGRSFGGFAGGLFAGMLGAGLIGLLMGNGLFGGLAGFASFLGLALQVVLIVLIARLAWTWWQRRNAPAAAGPNLRRVANDPNHNAYYGIGAAGAGAGAVGAAGAAGYGGAASAAPSSDIQLDKTDFDDFERLLSDISVAYAAADLGKLRGDVTPEMLSYFSEELSRQASLGHRSEVSDIKLLQGDLSEAWREGDAEYATVAMRYAIRDVTFDDNGAVVEGSRELQEVTELWTFLRSRAGRWILSAIQQA